MDEEICIHIYCNNPQAYERLEEIQSKYQNFYIDEEQSWNSWIHSSTRYTNE